MPGRRAWGLAALPALALALALTACSPANPGGAQPSSPGAEQPAAQLSAAQLETALGDYARQHPGARVLTDEQLRATIPAAQRWLEEARVDPAECGLTLTAPIADQVKHAVMGAVEVGEDLITVAVYPDTQTLTTQWQAQVDSSARCARYSVLVDGQSRAFHLAKQPVASDAALTEAYVVTGSDGQRTAQQLIVRSAQANILLGVESPTSSADTAEQLAAAAQTINDLLGRLT